MSAGNRRTSAPAPGMAECCCSLDLSTFLLTPFYFPHALALPTPQQGVWLEGGQIFESGDRVALSSWAQSVNWGGGRVGGGGGGHLPGTPWRPVNEDYVRNDRRQSSR